MNLLIDLVSDPHETARYILYRIKSLWPESLAHTSAHARKGSEQFSGWASSIPSSFRCTGQHGTIEVEVTGQSIRLKGDSGVEPIKALILTLAKDPLWGPDWLLGSRTRSVQ